MALNPKQNRFIAEYLVEPNAHTAAVKAGYSPKTARVQGPRLLSNAVIKREIEAALKRRSERVEVKQDDVLRALVNVLNIDIGRCFDEHGRLLQLHEMPEDARKAIASVEVTEIWERASDNPKDGKPVAIGTLSKLKLLDKMKAIELAGKHLGLFTEKVEHSGTVSIEVVNPYAEQKE